MIVLGIETSCDETSLCILESTSSFPIIHKTLTFSQIELYKEWGGVVPEIASRNHLKKIKPLLIQLLKETSLSMKDIELIGVTTTPGLLGPLLTGLNLAKSISFIHQTPILPINHLHAHIEAIHIDQKVDYPYLGLILSGGHSLFVKASAPSDFEILATTIDDAAGEAFDKGGKILGLDYPAGPEIDEISKEGDESAYQFPIGLEKEKSNPNMSFSGLKTSLLNLSKKTDLKANLQNIIASYQQAIIKNIIHKFTIIQKKNLQLPIVVGGGVACNSKLRKEMKENFSDVFFVSPKFCTDNAAMIANLCALNYKQALPYPECLHFDAKSRAVDKASLRGEKR